jgi:hypothetical protein
MAVRGRLTSARVLEPPVDPRPLVERLAPLNAPSFAQALSGDGCSDTEKTHA